MNLTVRYQTRLEGIDRAIEACTDWVRRRVETTTSDRRLQLERSPTA